MKRFIFLLISIFILLFAAWFYFSHSSDSNTQDATGTDSSDTKEPITESPQTPKAEDRIQEIIKAANTGQLPYESFKVGETDLSALKEKWGNPENISQTKVGLYASYNTQNITVGYYRHSPIFDIRSYKPELNEIHLKDIKKVMGNPKQVLSYDSNEVHQNILVYSLNNGNELKWIVNQPTADNQNPSVDHISIYDSKIADHSLSGKLNSLSLDEKIGQMLLIGMNGQSVGNDVKTMIQEERVGGIILYGKNIKSPNQTVKLTNELKSINQQANPSLPLFISVDQEGGAVERMPPPILPMPSNFTIGRKKDADLSYRVGETLGKETHSLGFNMNFAPVLDVIKDPESSVIGERSFGGNPEVVSRLGIATMKGLQSENVISVVKHFPGYGSVSVDAHQNLPTLEFGNEYLEHHDWLPYKNAIEQGADVVMVTHMLTPALNAKYPSSMSSRIITNMLRGELDFNGLIITDDMTMGAIENNYSIDRAAVESVKAGADVVMAAYHKDQQIAILNALKRAVKNGEISEQRIDNSVFRIMKIKEKYHLSNNQISIPDISSLNKKIKKITAESQ
ncbi:DUF4309 domain-containing protein [Virgibacillus sp. MSP4-1]|uniref:glycoside hydrolase family 3 N-terminal domain-containing protein n=1 Tax=Virgibacillus sp. MSP4-1 TaxID=2700081 RepID=UPI00039B1B3C|nr:glycoside hydrolase family 3 N-terminal domain-containing protein [Virgibacillus sp. MSP4-1]QHS23325.1 DUF4309 domain-containing protein [Virgibacillus sp. MSP4-1]